MDITAVKDKGETKLILTLDPGDNEEWQQFTQMVVDSLTVKGGLMIVKTDDGIACYSPHEDNIEMQH